MHSVKLTIAKILSVLFVACGLQFSADAQEISPYSRYGLGDMTPNRNVLSRGMGGIAAGVFDYQSINFTNPAAISGISNTIFDVAAEADVRNLKSSAPAKKFSSTNALFSYMQLGMPIGSRKMAKKNINWGLSFGLRPVSRIDYRIEKNERLTGIDSLNTLYEGSGGLNQVFLGTGLKFGKGTGKNYRAFSVGITAGYMFGSKDYSTKLTFINDSTDYFRSNSASKTNFGGVFFNAGLQYEAAIKSGTLRIGLFGNIKQNLKATQDIVRETFSIDANGNTYRVDSIYQQAGVKGTVVFPATIGTGFTYQDKHLLYGVDFEYTNWTGYSFYGKNEDVQNSWLIRAGAQYFPANEQTAAKKYFSFVRYRVGAFYGPDYVKLNSSRSVYGVTLGTGMPLTSLRRISYTGERATLNTAIEFGGRGDKNSSLKETTLRFNVGISMNASWFMKHKYD